MNAAKAASRVFNRDWRPASPVSKAISPGCQYRAWGLRRSFEAHAQASAQACGIEVTMMTWTDLDNVQLKISPTAYPTVHRCTFVQNCCYTYDRGYSYTLSEHVILGRQQARGTQAHFRAACHAPHSALLNDRRPLRTGWGGCMQQQAASSRGKQGEANKTHV